MATTTRKPATRAPATRKTSARKPAAKKPVKAAPAKSGASTTAVPAAAKDYKPRKPKMVRDSFTIPKNEYTVLDDLKQRAAKLGHPAKKSEVLRAGVQALAAMTDAAFLACVGAVPTVKTGRPAKD